MLSDPSLEKSALSVIGNTINEATGIAVSEKEVVPVVRTQVNGSSIIPGQSSPQLHSAPMQQLIPAARMLSVGFEFTAKPLGAMIETAIIHIPVRSTIVCLDCLSMKPANLS